MTKEEKQPCDCFSRAARRLKQQYRSSDLGGWRYPLTNAIMTALAKPVRVLTVYGRRGLGKGCSSSYSPSFYLVARVTCSLLPYSLSLKCFKTSKTNAPIVARAAITKMILSSIGVTSFTEAPPATGSLAPQVIIAVTTNDHWTICEHPLIQRMRFFSGGIKRQLRLRCFRSDLGGELCRGMTQAAFLLWQTAKTAPPDVVKSSV